MTLDLDTLVQTRPGKLLVDPSDLEGRVRLIRRGRAIGGHTTGKGEANGGGENGASHDGQRPPQLAL